MSKRTEIEKKEEAVLDALEALWKDIEGLSKASFFRYWPKTVKILNRQINNKFDSLMSVVDSMLTREEKEHDG